MRPLNLPQPIAVATDESGHPTLLKVDVPHPDGGTAERHTRTVDTVVEVWRVDDEWWREPISRRYFESVLEGGRHVVLYEDLTTGDWFMQRP